MLFGGNSGTCGGCGCKSCQECTRGCTEPHTGTAFETVYTLYFEGAEAGNPGDGYLTATGDVDTSDPYDGMDGTGPWEQKVSGTFTLQKSTTRYPCIVTVSFWRSNFVLGASTNPPPSAALTSEKIKVTNNPASEGPIVVDNQILEPGQSHELLGGFPLVPGAGDQSDADPRRFEGTARVVALCANDSVTFEVQATINWNVKKRQHVLYGLVRECYEDPDGPNPCASFCEGSSVPDTIYVAISNFAMDPNSTFGASNVAGVNGTYVLSRPAGFCTRWEGPWFGSDCKNGRGPSWVAASAVDTDGAINFGGFSNTDMIVTVSVQYTTQYQGAVATLCAYPLSLTLPAETLPELCGTGLLASGTNASGLADVYLLIGGQWSSGRAEQIACTFDWEITA
jgi:hypothetical protein